MKKTTSVKIDVEKLEMFNRIIEKFTKKFTMEFPSQTKTHYTTRFPDKNTYHNKYTIGDLLDEALSDFIEKYKIYV